jgi:RNA polymerase sigma-70 factor (ECF subfamily)
MILDAEVRKGGTDMTGGWDRHEPDGPGQPSPPEDEAGRSRGRAFLPLFVQAERRVYAYILTLLPRRADADDVMQEVSLVMWDKFDDRDPPRDFVAWGCRIAYLTVLDYRKRQRRQRVLFSQEMVERVAETALVKGSALQLDARREALADCLEKLSRRDRDLLSERFKAGATTRSTAERVGRSADAVYKALAKIRHALFECVSRTLALEGRT